MASMLAPTIPRVEIGRELGRGAHSVVYRAEREGRAYAVKVPLSASTPEDNDVAFRRFLREAVALARLRDPGLPAVMEVGRAGGAPYLVMELVAGETLADRLARGPLDEASVVALGLQVSAALETIHAAGLVHRDVKPRNIVFDSQTGKAALVDLGSAASRPSDTDPAGTRAYAAPELLSNPFGVADPRADLYSLGLVLLECFGASPIDSSREAALANVSAPLARAIQLLLVEDPARRCQSAGEFRHAMARLSPSAESGVSPRPRRTPLRGRASELDRMRRAWAEGQRRGGKILLVQGPAGAGKTWLVRAFLDDLAEAGATVLTASCHPRDPRAFSAVRQIVEGYLTHCEGLPVAERARALSRFKAIAGNLGPLLRLLSPRVARIFHDVPSVPASDNAEQAYAEGLADFLERLLREAGPVALFVDDVQWLDPSSRRVLSRAANQVSGMTGLLLFGARTAEADESANRFVDMVSAPVLRVELSALGDDELSAMASDYLGTRDLDPAIRKALLTLSGGLPLRALEVLRTLLEEGVLLPHWGSWVLDAGALARMDLPTATVNLLRRRLDRLDASTRAVLVTAAVIGMAFEDSVLAACFADRPGWTLEGLGEARRGQVVEADVPGTHRFVHHTVRDALLESCDEATLAEAHQVVAEVLDRELSRRRSIPSLRFEIEGAEALQTPSVPPLATASPADADPIYRVAFHYSAGVPGRAAARAAEVNVQAGRAAFERFDNERAIAFFEAAERAVPGAAFDADTRLLLAESRLRSGALESAVQEFERVIIEAQDPFTRATAFGRIAYVRDAQLDATRAWAALEAAFSLMGEESPRESLSHAVGSAREWLTGLLRFRPPHRSEGRQRARDQILCSLYYQASRIAFSSGNAARIVLSVVRALEPAARLGPSSAMARAYLTYAFVLTILGFRSAGSRYLATGEDIGRKLRDPVTFSHALQLHHVIAVWGGHVQESIDAGARCVTEYGHWRELNDYNLVVYTLHQLESVRGRDLEAWRWLTHALDRINRHDGAPLVPEFLLLGARAALIGLGREGDARALLHRVARATITVPKESGSYYPLMFSPRMKAFTEKMDLGDGLEALVSEFRALSLEPKTVHLAVIEYFIHLAHARVHACLRAPVAARAALLPELERCASELKAAARNIALFHAHAIVVQAFLHFFSGRSDLAVRSFDDAERVGRAENAPWVLYSVCRGRAHLLASEGSKDAARDQAVLAESIAVEHGSAYRAKWIREEFGLRPRRSLDGVYGTSAQSPSVLSDDTVGIAPGASRARRQLRALLRISQTRGQEFSPDDQAAWVVEELVQALRAQRGFLFLAVDASHATIAASGSGATLELVAGRDSSGRKLGESASYDKAAVEAALAAASDPEPVERASMYTHIATTSRQSTIAAPLVVDDVTVGVVCLDRPLAEGVFVEADAEILSALAGQVSIALELTRALRARERAEERLRNADKMEAVSRLARGIAHDLNNMLSAIKMATSAMAMLPEVQGLVGHDVKTIQVALQRANELTKQLGTFSRGEVDAPQVLDLAERVERLLPIIQGLVGEFVQVECETAAGLPRVRVDPNQIDQVLMNLAVNARDAMDGKGAMRLALDEVRLDEEYVREHPNVAPGPYVRFSISDTGCGIEAVTQQKIFEPYFTTKRDRGGTGLGLASVYWIVAQSGGHIDVKSAVGEGTTFSLFFPVADAGDKPRRPRRAATVLVVDEDAEALRDVAHTLSDMGYRALSARSSAEAIDVARRAPGELDLLVSTVALPTMNGLELSRELRKIVPNLGVLFISGDTSGVLAARGIMGAEVEILQKPVQPGELAKRAKGVLRRARKGPPS